MSLTRSGYKKLGLQPIKPLPDQSCQEQQKPMGDEKKDDGVGYPIKIFFKEALVRQRKK
jgi:hypothetical protein